ncbi:hypothetical protein BGZ47_008253, partial [Haplosporangium gracile]
DAKLCRQEEFYRVIEGLLKMIGGSVERPRMLHQLVVIAIGLAKFTAVHGPPALNGTLEAFFARSLGYLAIGISGHYSSKRCSDCYDFVSATSDWRILYCKTCKRFRQRDVMASENMSNAIKNHLIHHQRPLYLHPRPEAMNCIGDGPGGSGSGGAAAASPSMAAATNAGGPPRKRRAASIVLVEVPNTDVDPMADAPSSASGRTKSKARKNERRSFTKLQVAP